MADATPSPSAAEAETCETFDLGCSLGQGVENVFEGAVEQVAEAVTEAVATVIAALGTWWVEVDTPNLISTAAGDASAPVGFVQSSLAYYTIGFLVLSVMLAGGRMAWTRRGDSGRELIEGLVRFVIVATAGVAAIGLFTVAADGFANWIIDRSTQGTDFGTNLTALLGASTIGPLGPMLAIVLGLIAVLAAFLQMLLMFARVGMLVIAAGVLPTLAATATSNDGKARLSKAIGWTIAFILYKPAAAIVYATAFQLTGTPVFGDSGQGVVPVMIGLMMMIMALAALGPLMKIAVPTVGAMAAGGGGGMMGIAAAGASMTRMPTGARDVGGAPSGAGAATAGRSTSSGAAGAAGASGSGAANGSAGAAGPQGATAPGSNGTSPTPSRPAAPASSGGGPAGAGGGAAAAGSAGGGAAGSGGAAAAGAGPAGAAATAASAAANGARSGVRRAAGQSEEGPQGSQP